jgi:hypothetical protein
LKGRVPLRIQTIVILLKDQEGDPDQEHPQCPVNLLVKNGSTWAIIRTLNMSEARLKLLGNSYKDQVQRKIEWCMPTQVIIVSTTMLDSQIKRFLNL